jgi:phosphatidylinositol alpha 1,6-mannosyltransferase
MRVAIVSDVAVGMLSGVTTLLPHLVRRFEQGDHRLLFIGPRPRRPLSRSFDGLDCTTHLTPSVRLPFYRHTDFSVRLGRTSRRFLAAFEPDVVHLIDPWFIGPQGGAWAMRRGIPVVASFHTDIPGIGPHFVPLLSAAVAWKLCRWTHRHASLILAPTEAMARRLECHGIGPAAVWGRGVDAELFNPAKRCEVLRAKLLGPGRRHVVLYVGRVSPDKNVAFMLEALVSSTEKRLVIVGNGPSLAEMRARYEPRGVHFTGYLTGEDLARHYASADVFVFASQTDTYGQVLNEAIASELPVVAAENDVIREVLSGAGIYFPHGDAAALRCAVDRVLTDRHLGDVLTAEGRRIALSRTWPTASDQLLRYYDNVIAHHVNGSFARTGAASTVAE